MANPRGEDGNRYVRYNANGELLDETGKTLWDQIGRGFDVQAISQGAVPIGGETTVVMRYKPPFHHVPKYDSKGDAVQLVVDHIINMELPYYMAYVMGVNFAKYMKHRFEIDDDQTFFEMPEDAEEAKKLHYDGATWAKKIVDFIPKFASNCVLRSIDVNDRTAAWYNKLQVSCYTAKLKRKTQEDRMICLPSLELHKADSTPDVGLFGVFDGHGGAGVAMYAAAHLPYEMGRELATHLENTGEALKAALEWTDKRASARCQKEGWLNTGTTVVVAAVDDSNIHIRWLGDSPAYMMYESEMKKLTRAHNPKDSDESQRIKDLGGELIYVDGELRVNGIINLTRALGDLAGGNLISKESEALVLERNPDQYLLMMLCDGISDIFSQAQLYDMVKSFVLENDSDEYAEMAERFVRNANDAGTLDNCTCVIVFLRDPKDLWTMITGSEGTTSDNLSSQASQENSSSDD